MKLKIFPSKKAIKYQEMVASVGGVVMSFEGNPEKVIVKSYQEITVCFWFGDIFQEEISNLEGGLANAV